MLSVERDEPFEQFKTIARYPPPGGRLIEPRLILAGPWEPVVPEEPRADA